MRSSYLLCGGRSDFHVKMNRRMRRSPYHCFRAMRTMPGHIESPAELANSSLLHTLAFSLPVYRDARLASSGQGVGNGPWVNRIATWAVAARTTEEDAVRVADACNTVELKAVLIAAICAVRPRDGHPAAIRLRMERLLATLILSTAGEDLQVLLHLLDRASCSGTVPDSYELVYQVLTTMRPAVLQHVAMSSSETCMRPTVLSDLDDTLVASMNDVRIPHGALYPGVRSFLHELSQARDGQQIKQALASRYNRSTDSTACAAGDDDQNLIRTIPASTIHTIVGWWDSIYCANKLQPGESGTSASVRVDETILMESTQDYLIADDVDGMLRNMSMETSSASTRSRTGPGWRFYQSMRRNASDLGHRLLGHRFGVLQRSNSRKAKAAWHALSDVASSMRSESASFLSKPRIFTRHREDANLTFPIPIPGIVRDRDDVEIIQSPQRLTSASINTVFVITARPSGHRGFLKRMSVKALADMQPPLSEHIVVLMGSLLSSGSHAAMARTKLDHIAKIHALRPGSDLVFIGDSGQGDALTAVLASTAPGALSMRFKLGLIHDITGAGLPEIGGIAKGNFRNVLPFQTYLGAAAAVLNAGLISREAALRVCASAVDETKVLLCKPGWRVHDKSGPASIGTWMAYKQLLQRDLAEIAPSLGPVLAEKVARLVAELSQAGIQP